jgi:hypothetical protein
LRPRDGARPAAAPPRCTIPLALTAFAPGWPNLMSLTQPLGFRPPPAAAPSERRGHGLRPKPLVRAPLGPTRLARSLTSHMRVWLPAPCPPCRGRPRRVVLRARACPSCRAAPAPGLNFAATLLLMNRAVQYPTLSSVPAKQQFPSSPQMPPIAPRPKPTHMRSTAHPSAKSARMAWSPTFPWLMRAPPSAPFPRRHPCAPAWPFFRRPSRRLSAGTHAQSPPRAPAALPRGPARGAWDPRSQHACCCLDHSHSVTCPCALSIYMCPRGPKNSVRRV